MASIPEVKFIMMEKFNCTPFLSWCKRKLMSANKRPKARKGDVPTMNVLDNPHPPRSCVPITFQVAALPRGAADDVIMTLCLQ